MGSASIPLSFKRGARGELHCIEIWGEVSLSGEGGRKAGRGGILGGRGSWAMPKEKAGRGIMQEKKV